VTEADIGCRSSSPAAVDKATVCPKAKLGKSKPINKFLSKLFINVPGNSLRLLLKIKD
jgi:hypothetical protein